MRTAQLDAGARRRHFMLLGASLAMLVALAFVAYQLALARLPAQRAALAQLIEHETGLAMTFSTVSVRWGWYGPEAVFAGVALGEPGSAQRLLAARRLRVSFDPWRIARSASLSASHVLLEAPDIDLAGLTPARTQRAAGLKSRAGLLQAVARVLARWQGGEIDIRDARLSAPSGAGPLIVGVRYAQLWRSGLQWRAQAQLSLPQDLGEHVRVTLDMHGDPLLPELSSGTLRLEGRQLLLGGLKRLLPPGPIAGLLPDAGQGDLTVSARFAHGRLHSANGEILARPLEWSVTDASGAARVLALARIAGHFTLERRQGLWRLSAPSLALGAATDAPAAVLLEVGLDGRTSHGVLQGLPLATLATLAEAAAPQLPLSRLRLGGRARQLDFQWSAARSPGARLALAADLDGVSIADAGGDVQLAGLAGEVSGTEGELTGQLDASAAQLGLRTATPAVLTGVDVHARLRLAVRAEGWQLTAEDLQLRRADMSVQAHGSLGAHAGESPRVEAQLSVRDADAALLDGLVNLPAATQLAGGRIDSAQVSWRGPLDEPAWSAPQGEFSAHARLSDARLHASQSWPEVSGMDAELSWYGARGHADITRARSGQLRLNAASADWDARGVLSFSGTLAGEAAEALAWLREHPQSAPWTAALSGMQLRGELQAQLRVSATAAAAPQVQVAAMLDSGELRALSGLPPLTDLHGALHLAGGHLERSRLLGRWLGGPLALTVSEGDGRAGRLVIQGRGQLQAQQSLRAAGVRALPLEGSCDWSARLSVAAGAAGARWQLHAETSLVGIASGLPEPFAKAAGAALPLQVELGGDEHSGQLRLALGSLTHAAALLENRGDSWRIERGAVRLGAGAADLPEDAVLDAAGSVGNTDLAALLALMRGAGADAALPAMRVHLFAARFTAGGHSFPAVSIAAQLSPAGGELQLSSESLAGSARWPRQIDGEHPARLQLAAFDIAPADANLAGALAAVLAPAAQLSVDRLTVQGRALGALAARLSVTGSQFAAEEISLNGPAVSAHGQGACAAAACRLSFTLGSTDTASLLEALGLRPELASNQAALSGELHWAPGAEALGTLGGDLHMRVGEGTLRARQGGDGVAFGLLAVPALLAVLAPQAGEGAVMRSLSFAHLTADYDIADGVANTRDLHLDGSAEILMRGAVGLASQDYDLQAVILRGGDRLPAAVRSLAPMPPIAAAWLSLRELVGATDREHARSALRLRGTWDDPIVMPEDTR